MEFEDRIDPRLREFWSRVGSIAVRPASTREELVDRAASPKGRFAASRATEFFDSLQDDSVAPPDGLDESVHQLVSEPDGNTVNIRLIRPAAASALPGVCYLHGGAMRQGSCFDGMYVSWGRLIAHQGVAVAMVDFRNSLIPSSVPETGPFPAGLNDCVSAVRWLRQHTASLGIDADRLIVAGDSGGGNLAIATALRLKASGGPRAIHGVYASSPMLAGTWPQESLPTSVIFNGLVLDLSTDTAPLAYGIEQVRAKNPLAWPLFASTADLDGLPPTVITVSELDPLRDEGIEMYRRLMRAGVRAQCRELTGMVHSAEVMCTVVPDVSGAAAAAIAAFAQSR